ncbi:hypothetical protein GGQ99_004788 [Aminobacter niigataensis]|uniref:Uncharacterized protein n=1 Tax=Aminobacter niigataensis TaxID=83265 RepID=A0ABR6L876_9HYPH|nr:hypothetical protein [Aminobacter niigataensis]MBB4653004.1 hypothetical protein [Aminobacter niigataensis]
MRDIISHIDPKRGISPAAAVTDNTAFVSQINNRLGVEAVAFLLLMGSIADADVTFTFLMEHGDAANMSDATAVPDDMLNGTELLATPLFSSDDKVFKIGYTGGKQYQRVTLTPVANTGNIFVAGAWLNSRLNLGPAANPPA